MTINENTIIKESLYFQITDTEGKVLMIVKDSKLEFPDAKNIQFETGKIKTINDKNEFEDCGHTITIKVYTKIPT